MTRHSSLRLSQLLLLAVAGLSVGCSKAEDGPPDIVRIEIAEAAMLPALDATRAPQATGYDARDQAHRLDAGVSWAVESGALDVSNGVLSSTEYGSGTLRAKYNGLESGPMFVAVTKVKQNVTLVADADVLEPIAETAIPFRLRTTLRGSFEVGEKLVGTGQEPILGEVIEAERDGDATMIVFELIALPDLFDELEFHASYDDELEIQPREGFAVEDRDGEPTLVLESGEGLRRQALESQSESDKIKLLFFECEVGAGFGFTFADGGTMELTPKDFVVSADYSLSGGDLSLSASGGFDATAEFKPRLTAAVEAKASCKAEAGVITLPIGGPLSLVFGAEIPLGIGFETSAKLDVSVGIDVTTTVSNTISLGLNCVGGSCEFDSDATADLDVDFDFVWPDSADVFDVELEASAFGYAELAAGSKVFSGLKLSALEAKGGLKAEADLATWRNQLADPSGASMYRTALFLTVGTSAQLDDVACLFGVTLEKFETDLLPPLGLDFPQTSPAGELKLDKPLFSEGEDITGTVELDPATVEFGGVDNVAAVRIYRETGDDTAPFLLVDEFAASGGTDPIPWSWTPDVTLPQPVKFYAAVVDGLFGLALEVKADSGVSVTIGESLILYQSDRTGDWDIYSVNPETLETINLTNDPTAADDRPHWSADRSKIFFRSDRDGLQRVWQMDPDGTNAVPVTPDGVAAGPFSFSPDGERLTYGCMLGRIDQTVAPIDFTVENGDCGSRAAWSKDGSMFAFKTGTDASAVGFSGLFVFGAQGAMMPQYLTEIDSDAVLTWGPGDKILAYGRNAANMPHLFSVNADGSDSFIVSYETAFGTWMPNGTQIVFALYDGTDREIALMDGFGGNVIQLTNDTTQNRSWVSSPDGSQIAYVSNGTDDEIYMVDINTLATVNLSMSPGNDWLPAW